MSSFYSATIEFVSKQLYLRQINSSQCWYSSTAVSGKHHNHHSHQHPWSPDPNHLIIDSPHLPPLIKLPIIKSHSTVHTRSLSSLRFTTPNCTWLSDVTNLCVLTFQSPMLLQWFSRVAPVRPRTLCSGSPTKKETQTPTRCTKYYLHHFNLPATALFDHHIPSCSINLLVTHLPVCVWPILWQTV